MLYISAQEFVQAKSPSGSSDGVTVKEPFLATKRADQTRIMVPMPVQTLVRAGSLQQF